MHSSSHRSHEEVIAEELRDDPACAAAYLGAVLEDGNTRELTTVLRRLDRALGAGVLKPSELDAQRFHKVLSVQGNPALESLLSLLQDMGMRLVIQPSVRRRV